MSGKEFPNNWDEIKDAPDEAFESCTYEEFMEGMQMWQIPSSHCVLIRVKNKQTGKVKELAYQKMHYATRRCLI